MDEADVSRETPPVKRTRAGGSAGAKRTSSRPPSKATTAKMADVAEMIETGIGAAGLGLGMVGLKTTAHTTVRVAPELAKATVKLAANNPKLLALMSTMSDLTPWFQAGQGIGAIITAAAIDLGAASPVSFLAVNLDVRDDWLAVHPEYAIDPETGQVVLSETALRSVS